MPVLGMSSSRSIWDASSAFHIVSTQPVAIWRDGGCQIAPDYSQSVQEVFTDAAREMIRTTNQLDVLHLKGVLGSGRSGILPSWVPD